MSKGLEALAYLMERQNNLEKYGSSGEFSISKLRSCLDVIGKELKALEIIKEKGLNVNDIAWLKRNDYEGYKWNLEQLYKDYDDEHLEQILKTQEEYDLLKEVLK